MMHPTPNIAPANHDATTRYSRLLDDDQARVPFRSDYNNSMPEMSRTPSSIASSSEVSGLRPELHDINITVPSVSSTSVEQGTMGFPTETLVSASKHTASPVAHSLPRRWHPKTVSVILGFILAAFLAALGHYLLFLNLDGTAIDSGSFTQSNVSAVSILLVTLYKSSLAAAVGSCFAQHLWLVLREDTTSVSLIEKLFVLRSNVFALGDPRAIWRAPVLFSMALFVWCLGIATIYPPGALTVGLLPSTSTSDMEVLSMNRPPPTEFDPNTFARPEPFPTLAALLWSIAVDVAGTHDYLHFNYDHARPALNNIAQSIMMGDRLINTPSHTGENSSYSLQFRAPQFQCNTSTSQDRMNLTSKDYSYPESIGPDFKSSWNSDRSVYVVEKYVMRYIYASQRNQSRRVGVIDVQRLECQGVSALFDLRITHPKGIQEIDRNITDMKPLVLSQHQIGTGVSMPPAPYTNTSNYGEDVRNLTKLVASKVPTMNEVALLDAFGRLAESESNQTCFARAKGSIRPTSGSGDCGGHGTLDDGTSVLLCEWNCTNVYAGDGSFPLRGTALDTSRFNNTQFLHFENTSSTTFVFDPVTDINPTEDLLNTLIYNITLSAFSLGTWKENVSVTTTLWHNAYRFSHKRNLVLPYSICLGIAIAFAVIAIWSLHQNGIPAADGGLLQVMMATRGDTQMERLVLKGGNLTAEEMLKEIGGLKIRYGELVMQEGRMGFGTVDETLALKKRK